MKIMFGVLILTLVLPSCGKNSARVIPVEKSIGNAGDIEETEERIVSGGATCQEYKFKEFAKQMLLSATKTCEMSGTAFDLKDSQDGVYASYRKDYYLEDYNESGDNPLYGGRFHIAAVAKVTGNVQQLFIDGVDVETKMTPEEYQWFHVWPNNVVAGEPLWVSFHSRSQHWDSAQTATITVKTDSGDAVSGQFSVAQTKVPITYVTISKEKNAFLIHMQNRDDKPHVLTKFLLNGREVAVGDLACIADTTIRSQQTVMFTVPVCHPIEIGSAWTVVAQWQSTSESVGVGRVLQPDFMVETWPALETDCPFPDANDGNFSRHLQAGFDTFYLYYTGENCSIKSKDIVNETAPQRGDFKLLVGDDFAKNPEEGMNTQAVAGILTGDEIDGSWYDDNGKYKTYETQKIANKLWEMYPDVAVYNGGKTNLNVGSFAGVTDVQGMDFYVAACAPHITSWGTHPPLRASFDYLKNARNNHMPQPTWLYAQGLASTWNKTNSLLNTPIIFQPDPQEILIQAFSVAAAGGKGLMWFMSKMEEANRSPARWEAISRANWTFRAVRDYLREGDITGFASSGNQSITEAIRARDAIIVPLISTNVVESPTDSGCAMAQIGLGEIPHWKIGEHLVDLKVDIPDDFGVYEVFEVRGKTLFQVTPEFDGRTLILSNIRLDNSEPVKMFVISEHAEIKAEILSLFE